MTGQQLTARYRERGLRDAAEARAQLVVLRLDTPGGLESSMRTMTQAIMASRVPVAVYVTPPGARAASAGMFLTLAAPVAAMAPGTNIGAAHPVGIGGGESDSIMTGKVVNDGAAFWASVPSLGSLLLYQPFGIPSPTAPAVRVSPWLVAAMTAGMTAFFGLVVRALVRAQRAEVLTGIQALVGRIGVAVTNLNPGGQVRVDSEMWSATAEYGSINAGEEVEVVDVEGVTLLVRRPSA